MDDTHEWRMAVRELSETERETSIDSRRAALGIVGDKDDDKYGRGND